MEITILDQAPGLAVLVGAVMGFIIGRLSKRPKALRRYSSSSYFNARPDVYPVMARWDAAWPKAERLKEK